MTAAASMLHVLHALGLFGLRLATLYGVLEFVVALTDGADEW